LLEKAWAKACGSYAKSIGGVTAESLKCLTGAPVYTLNHNQVDIQALWEHIYHADQNKYVMACAIGEEDHPGEH